MLSPVPADTEGNSVPALREMRIELRSVVGEAKAGEAKDCRLPQAAKRGGVDAACGIAHVIAQIDFAGLMEVALGKFEFAEPRSNEGVNRWA
jgi:hypothetical protein